MGFSAGAGRFVVSLGAVAAVTVAYVTLVSVNPTTVALTYLVVILFIAAGWGIAEATTASVAAMFCFNFFFLPPVGTLTIADPQNWVALATFLVTSVVASQLSGRARRRTVEAVARQRDLERLYSVSRALLLAERREAVPTTLARHIADAFSLVTVGVYDRRTDAVAWGGAHALPALETSMRHAARTGTSSRDPSAVVMPIHLGGAPVGSLALTDTGLSDTVTQSIVNLVAIGLERARVDETTARAEAARESSEVRAAVLDALAHEFKTPLTSARAASSDLLTDGALDARERELVGIIDEDIERLQALVTDAVQMLRIDAGEFAVHAGRHPLAAVVAGVIDRLASRLDGRPILTHVPVDLVVEVDRNLLALALRQLLDNAVKYSPADTPITVTATANGQVSIAVHNEGPAIAEPEQAQIFERFYRGAQARRLPGTGMGLAIVAQIARAHGGAVSVSSSGGAGTTFTLTLPRGRVAE